MSSSASSAPVADTNGKALDAPIPFITLSDDDNTFEINAQAIDFLNSLRGPVAIVSIAGLYRTGKSYLLNLLLGRDQASDMFQVGATVNACTKGIWIWGQPLASSLSSGSSSTASGLLKPGTTVVFLDTEGLGSTQRSQTQDSRLFAIALLLSSLFIYNSRGVIDSSAIEDLSLVVHLTKYIQVHATASDSSASSSAASDQDATTSSNAAALAQFFPDFLWIVRDFTLQLEEDGKQMTSRDYLELALQAQQQPTGGTGQDALEVAAKNQIRAVLTNFFPTRDCVTMVRPLHDETALRELVHQPFESLRVEFRDQLDVLRHKIAKTLKPKTLWNQPLTGSMLVSLAQNYVQAFNSSTTPVIASAWDRVVQTHSQQALENAKQVFATTLETQLREQSDQLARLLHPQGVTQVITSTSTTTTTMPLDDAAIHKCYEHARTKALNELYRDEIKSLTVNLRDFHVELSHFMTQLLEKTYHHNDQVSAQYNKALLQSLFQGHRVLEHDNDNGNDNDDDDKDHQFQFEFQVQVQNQLNDPNRSISQAKWLLQDAFARTSQLMEKNVARYQTQAKGPCPSIVLADFASDRLCNDLLTWSLALKQVFKTKESELLASNTTLRATWRTLDGKARATQELLAHQTSSYERAIESISSRLVDEKATLKAEIDHKQMEIDRARNQIDQLTSLHRESLDRLASQLARLTQERRQLEQVVHAVAERQEHEQLATSQELLATTRTFQQDARELLASHQELAKQVVELESHLGHVDTEQMKDVFRFEQEKAKELAALQHKLSQQQQELKETMIQDLRALSKQQDEELQTFESELQDKKALLSSLQEQWNAKEQLALEKKNKLLGDDCLIQ